DDAVGPVHEDNLGAVTRHLVLVIVAVGDEYHQVAGHAEARRRTIELHHATAGGAGTDVGREPLPVADVDPPHLLVLDEIGGLHQVGIQRQRTLVIEVRRRDRRAVNLALHQPALHLSTYSPSTMLSIRRVLPTLAATAITVPSGADCTGSSRTGSITAI